MHDRVSCATAAAADGVEKLSGLAAFRERGGIRFGLEKEGEEGEAGLLQAAGDEKRSEPLSDQRGKSAAHSKRTEAEGSN